ncbi:MAG TPA: alpha/beta fold hydrolase [Polyangia bacterium]
MQAFRPPLLLRSRHVQTILATTGPRRLLQRNTWRALRRHEREVTLDAGQGIRLSGLFSGHDGHHEPRDLVTLIHGWEGSGNSLYVLSAAGYLFDQGFDVFRLHLRDHGNSHHLNREPFTCTRLREAVEALGTVDRQFPHRRHFLVGFSLGGNFALRMAMHAAGIDLAKVVAICPVVLPHRTMEDLEAGFFVYHAYFLFKWKRSLRKKLTIFPDLGYGAALATRHSLRTMNEYFVPHLTEFAKPIDYFMGYAIAGDVLAGLSVPSHILAAADDPVIDVRHFDQVARPPCLSLEIASHGGHCGFVKNYRMDSWANERIAEILKG